MSVNTHNELSALNDINLHSTNCDNHNNNNNRKFANNLIGKGSKADNPS